LTCVFYVSGHGFGHASRDIEVIHAIHRRHPGVRVVVRTAVPESFFAVSARTSVEIQPLTTDAGVVQLDSVRVDEAATVRQAADFYSSFDQRVADETRSLASLEAAVVVGDAPPLAFAAAASAGVPSILLANFTWDWIYEAYPDFASRGSVLHVIRAAYAKATTALRLPFHGGFETVRDVLRDIPLIARTSQRAAEDTRAILGIDARRPAVLASFSRYGVGLPYDRLASDGRFTLVVTDHEGYVDPRAADRFICISKDRLRDSGLRYEDLVAAVDVVVSKPGYGIVSECIANGAALLYASRSGFAEQALIIREMAAVLKCRPISASDFFEGRWWNHIEALLGQPDIARRLATDGADVAADVILTAAARVASGARS